MRRRFMGVVSGKAGGSGRAGSNAVDRARRGYQWLVGEPSRRVGRVLEAHQPPWWDWWASRTRPTLRARSGPPDRLSLIGACPECQDSPSSLPVLSPSESVDTPIRSSMASQRLLTGVFGGTRR